MAITHEEIYPGMSLEELKLAIMALRMMGADAVEPNALADKLTCTLPTEALIH